MWHLMKFFKKKKNSTAKIPVSMLVFENQTPETLVNDC